MKENSIGTFDLIPTNEPNRKYLVFQLAYKDSILIGNIDEGQYLRMQRLSIGSGNASEYRVFEKIGEEESEIGVRALAFNKAYRLKGTNFVVRALGFRNIRLYKSPNVTIVRQKGK